MRLAALIVVAMLVASGTGAAAPRPDPRSLVLRKRDVPSSYTILRAHTGVLSNAAAAQGNRDLIAGFKSWLRLTGYNVEYQGGIKGTIGSRADVFASARGARSMLQWVVAGTPSSTGLEFVRREPSVGNGAYVYRKDFGTLLFVVVEWRFRNIYAHIGADGVGVRGALALARVQQNRIEAALK